MSLRVRGRSRVIDVLLVAALAVAGTTPAFATETHQFDVPVEDAPSAIRDFASQAHVQILVAGENVRGKHLHAVSGEFSTEQALRLLLADSGLSPRYVADRSIALVSGEDASPSPQDTVKEGKRDSSGDFRVAQVASGADSQSPAVKNSSPSVPGNSTNTELTEIIVTAQKRSERLQDVPVPVTAINAETLVTSNQLRLQDYYTSVPGLTVTPAGTQGYQLLSIRGITTGGGTNPTVGVTVDDVPYAASTNLGGGLVLPDIDPNDLSQVEVLRGPQGTLYGANSMGGLIKFVTIDPSTDALSGRVQAGTSSVYNGTGLGYNVRGSVNVPLSDTFAIRASGFTREDPGYIDNPVLHINGINEDHASGGRLAALWKPLETFSVKLSALIQQTHAGGSNDVDVEAGLGDLQQNYLRGVGGYDREFQAYSAVITAKLGDVDLTAVSGFNVNSYRDSWDLSYADGVYANLFFGVPGAPVTDSDKTKKFTQEVRMSMPIGSRVDWLLGGFYTHESSHVLENILAENSASGEDVGLLLTLAFPTTYEEYAAFTDFTVHFTDQFDVQLGGRETEIRQTYSQTSAGAFVQPPIPEESSRANAFTYLVTPRFKLSPDLMVYARAASGYRAGGSNTSPGGIVPAQYSPDKTQNYEVGLKGDFLEHALSLDASLYHIDWKAIQLQLLNPATGLSYNFNGSRAKSQGIELSLQSRPLTGLTVGAWVVWDEAVLTEPFPATSTAYGLGGDSLPYGSRFSGNVSAEQDFPIAANTTGFVGAMESYVGDRQGVFTAAASVPRQYYPAYAKMDLRAGVKYESWTADLYVNNATDKRGELSGGVGQFPPFAFTYIQPRTVGISLGKNF
jgi:iron complex outermembrane recepter protein